MVRVVRMSKFKLGEKVTVSSRSHDEFGSDGHVIAVNPGGGWDYYVSIPSRGIYAFSEGELESLEVKVAAKSDTEKVMELPVQIEDFAPDGKGGYIATFKMTPEIAEKLGNKDFTSFSFRHRSPE